MTAEGARSAADHLKLQGFCQAAADFQTNERESHIKQPGHTPPNLLVSRDFLRLVDVMTIIGLLDVLSG